MLPCYPAARFIELGWGKNLAVPFNSCPTGWLFAAIEILTLLRTPEVVNLMAEVKRLSWFFQRTKDVLTVSCYLCLAARHA
jgi:hypothetical protein